MLFKLIKYDNGNHEEHLPNDARAPKGIDHVVAHAAVEARIVRALIYLHLTLRPSES